MSKPVLGPSEAMAITFQAAALKLGTSPARWNNIFCNGVCGFDNE